MLFYKYKLLNLLVLIISVSIYSSANKPERFSINHIASKCIAIYDLMILEAASNGNVINLIEALKNGADVNIKNRYNGYTTPIMLATKNNHLEIMQELINANADINLQDTQGCTAIMIATQNSNIAIMQKLIESGADINLINKDGDSALLLAIFNRNTSMIDFLLANSADNSIINKNGFSALKLLKSL